MRIAATPGETFGSLAQRWPRTGSAKWRYTRRSTAFGAEASAPLPDLIEALAPLGMPELRYASRRSDVGGWHPRTRAATHAAISWAHSTVINSAAVLVIHFAAIRYVFLPIVTT